MNYLHDWCSRQSDCFDWGRWTAVWSDGWWGRWDYSSFNIVVGTISSIGSSCSSKGSMFFTLTAAVREQRSCTFSITGESYLFWLPCTCHSCQKSHPLFGSSPRSLRRRRHRRHWTITPRLHPTTAHLCDICRGSHNFVKQAVCLGTAGKFKRTHNHDNQVNSTSWTFSLLTCWVSDSAGLSPAHTGLSGPWKSGRTQWIQVLCRSYPQCELWEI